jgi:RNA polymerase sigma-70 factor (ECF subfamily)
VTDPSLIARFEENRPHLRAVAYRMLGSTSETEDALQETWLRITRADAGALDNLGGWLTTVITHVCLDMLRARKTRENAAPAIAAEGAAAAPEPTDPEREVLLADAVGSAMMIVLDTLSPAERVAFVLHDLFALSFEDIGAIVGRSRRGSSRAAREGSCRGPERGRESSRPSAKSPTPSWPPRATAISRRCSPCSIPTSCCASTPSP